MSDQVSANLRPPNPNPSKETNGRKSNKRRTRAEATKLNDESPGSDDEMSLSPRDEEDGRVSPVGDISEMNPLGPSGQLCENSALGSTSTKPQEIQPPSSQDRLDGDQGIRRLKRKRGKVEAAGIAGTSKRVHRMPRRLQNRRFKEQEEELSAPELALPPGH